MIYTDLTIKAIKIAFKAHDGQIDKSGVPYITHPIHIAEQMKDEDSCVVALLHDVLEDTDITEEELLEEGFTKKQVDAIKVMTRKKTIPYMVYIKKIRENPLASTVKKADLTHNMDLSRISNPTKDDEKRCTKYSKALLMLDGVK